MKDMENKEKKKIEWSAVWPEARDLVWRHRKRMVLGFVLLLISRAAGMVLPASTKSSSSTMSSARAAPIC